MTDKQPINDSVLASSFPADFIWGSATASYQIEGAAHEDGRGPSIWDTFAATPGKVYMGHNGDVADDHYHRVEEDVELMSRLGLDAYRFSVAWPRILPTGRGTVNTRGLDFYDRLVDALLTKGIKPCATLYHWDLPQPLEDKGGWRNRETAYAFADYAEIVARRLGDRIAGWITLNEPWCSAYLGYGIGMHAPGVQDRQAAMDAGHHLLLAHGLAMPRIRAIVPQTAEVGITLNFTPAYPSDNRPETLRDTALLDAFSNRWFLDPIVRGHYPEGYFASMGLNEPPIQEGDLAIISTPIDFMGINYYSRNLVKGVSEVPLADRVPLVTPVPEASYTDMPWEIYPQGLSDHLLRLYREYGIQKLYVTENGAAFKESWKPGDEHVHDPRRVEYLRQHVQALAVAIEQGAPLKGYFVWSLMDNYEWAEGYTKRFGIVYVDYETLQRIPKDSALWYADFIAAAHQVHQY
ncbi:GH1 family beta-glucosidase [Tengunoibacter tsumagoiensis]|uniref:Beta-glucosidase n=1 Tax=Tengunoibacter tsumagoiensis TaxID=2014871 RepID=A0A402A521_9CHLR|nr:GH1 family beta-glucosidase [Tengunoibacter tsumagoiensis]GCE14159.1 beta-glucosidase [Tengunoibacter tsumagoiensis]